MGRNSHYERRSRYKRTCPVCGSAFFSKRRDAIYDGPACRKAASRAMLLLAKLTASGKTVLHTLTGQRAKRGKKP